MKKNLIFALICLVSPLLHFGQNTIIRTFGGTNVDYGVKILPMPNGNLLAVCVTASFGEGNTDVYFIQLDSNLNKINSKTYGTEESEIVTNSFLSGNLIYVIGYQSTPYFSYQGFVYVFNQNLELEKKHLHGETGWDFHYTANVINDTLYTFSESENANGEMIFTIYQNHFLSNYENKIVLNQFKPKCVFHDNGKLIVGGEKNTGNENDFTVKLFNKQLVEIFEYQLQLPRNQFIYNVKKINNEFIFTGKTNHSDSTASDDALFVFFDHQMNFRFYSVLQDYNDPKNDVSYQIIPALNTDFLFSGTTENFGEGAKDIYICRIGSNGYWQFGQTFGSSENDELVDIIEHNGKMYGIGYSNGFTQGDKDVLVLQYPSLYPTVPTGFNVQSILDQNPNQIVSIHDFAQNSLIENLHFYPNPIHQNEVIHSNIIHQKIEIFNFQGKLLQQLSNTSSIKMDFNKGIYLIKTIDNYNITISKIIIH
jgi:hypothetical protein